MDWDTGFSLCFEKYFDFLTPDGGAPLSSTIEFQFFNPKLYISILEDVSLWLLKFNFEWNALNINSSVPISTLSYLHCKCGGALSGTGCLNVSTLGPQFMCWSHYINTFSTEPPRSSKVMVWLMLDKPILVFRRSSFGYLPNRRAENW